MTGYRAFPGIRTDTRHINEKMTVTLTGSASKRSGIHLHYWCEIMQL